MNRLAQGRVNRPSLRPGALDSDLSPLPGLWNGRPDLLRLQETQLRTTLRPRKPELAFCGRRDLPD